MKANLSLKFSNVLNLTKKFELFFGACLFSKLEKMVLLGENFPNFLAKTTEGEVMFHDWLKDS